MDPDEASSPKHKQLIGYRTRIGLLIAAIAAVILTIVVIIVSILVLGGEDSNYYQGINSSLTTTQPTHKTATVKN